MRYILKDECANDIKAKYRNKYISEKLGLSATYISLILNKKVSLPKATAYSFTKVIDNKFEITDLFETM